MVFPKHDVEGNIPSLQYLLLYRGRGISHANIGKTVNESIAQWNADNAADLVE